MSKIPGVVWSSLLVALPLVAVWLGDSFPVAAWAAPLAGALLIIAKVIESVMVSRADNVPDGVMAINDPMTPRPNLWWG